MWRFRFQWLWLTVNIAVCWDVTSCNLTPDFLHSSVTEKHAWCSSRYRRGMSRRLSAAACSDTVSYCTAACPSWRQSSSLKQTTMPCNQTTTERQFPYKREWNKNHALKVRVLPNDCVHFQARSQNIKKRILVSSCPSVRLSIWRDSAPNGFIFMKIVEYFQKKLFRKFKCH